MREFNIDFNKSFIKVIIVYAAIFLAGLIMAMPFAFGVNLDINFSGGTKIAYSYSDSIKVDNIKAVVEKELDKKVTVTQSTSIAGDNQTFEIALIGKEALSTEKQEALTKTLTEKYKDNKIELYNSTSVSPTMAGTFFIKSLVAVLITAILVIIYVGIRFRKIGGISAAMTAFCALILDVLITFFTCVIFRLQFDANYIAVILTILGYSLNDTIVIYDRIRENERFNPDMEIGELVNMSVIKVLTRNIVTTVTTFGAVMTIVVVSELFGLTSLRSFAIPMAFGLVSGAITSIFVAPPIWVKWKRYKMRKSVK